MKKRMRAVLADRGAPPPASPAGAWPLREGFAIGGVPLANRVVQAPLAGIANWAFRRQSRRHGAGLAVSEMVASFGVHHGNRRTLDMLRIVPDEHPVGVQLFGSEPEVMAEAARAAEEAGADPSTSTWAARSPRSARPGRGRRCWTTSRGRRPSCGRWWRPSTCR
jgi:hypothetical protein